MRSILGIMLVATLAGGLLATATEPAIPEVNSIAGEHLVEMFKVGFDPGPDHLKQARRKYDAAREAAKGDPRIDYAFGLVLVKQMRNQEAVLQFQAVTRQSRTECWPAWQALIWVHLISKDYVAGHERLKDYVRLIADPQLTVDQDERQQAAEWIGQVVAALKKSVDTVKQREALVRLDESMQEILGPNLQSSFERGKQGVQTLNSVMEEDVQQTREAAQAKSQKERAEKEAQVAKDLEASAEKREVLKKSAEDGKKYFDEQLAAFDKQLTRLERDYDFLQKRALSISTSQLQLNAEFALLEKQTNNTNNTNSRNSRSAGLTQAYQQRKAVLEVQQVKYQVELDQTMVAAVAVSQKAQAVAGQRVATVKQYERATGQLVQQDSKLDQWQDRLKKDGDKLKAPAKNKPAVVTTKIQQTRSFRTYVDLDLALERDRLLDSFGVAMPEKP